MHLEDLEILVAEAIKSLPKEFKRELDNVGFVVEAWPTEEEMESIRAHPGSLLFGLYRGIPKTKRFSNYTSLPDKIIIYAGPILMTSGSFEELKAKIQETVFHEIGHHFGLSDEQIRKAQFSLTKNLPAQ